MGVEKRVGYLRDMENLRGRPIISYITSPRHGANGQISGDMVAELMNQLQRLPTSTKELDLLLVSNGGDPTAAWRIVSLIRERVEKFSVLIPQAAYSAATLIALGANEIVMHPNGNLGPIDTQIHSNSKDKPTFGSEELTAFLKFARDEVGITDQAQLLSVFNHFCEEVGSVAVGVAARGAQLGLTMGEKLLQLHMTADANKSKARAISEKLTRDFFHHGYPVSRTEAKSIGLPVAAGQTAVESLMWKIWLDVSEELCLRSMATDFEFLRNEPGCAPLFGPVAHVLAPVTPVNGQPPGQGLAMAQQAQPVLVAPAPYRRIHALMESPRLASHFITEGELFAMRLPDLNLKVGRVPNFQGWKDVNVPAASDANTKVSSSTKRSRPTMTDRKSTQTGSKTPRRSVARS